MATIVLLYVALLLSRNDDNAGQYLRLERISGQAAYVLLALSVALGIVLSSRWRSFTRPWLLAERLHPLVLLAAFVLLSLHLLGLVLIKLPLYQLLIPFTSDYRPLWVGIGMLATYTGIVLVASTYVISYIGFRTWRLMHYAGGLIWALATVHGLESTQGSIGLYVGAAILVVGLFAFRLFRRPSIQAEAAA